MPLATRKNTTVRMPNQIWNIARTPSLREARTHRPTTAPMTRQGTAMMSTPRQTCSRMPTMSVACAARLAGMSKTAMEFAKEMPPSRNAETNREPIAEAATNAPKRAMLFGGASPSAESCSRGVLQIKANNAPMSKPNSARSTIEFRGKEKYFS